MRIGIGGIGSLVIDDGEMDGGVIVQLELYGHRGCSESVLDLKREEQVFSGEVEIGVGPSGDVTASAEGLPWILGSGFSGVVNE